MRGVPILVAHGSARGAQCSAMLLKMSSPVLNHRMLGVGSGRQSAISMRMTYGGQRQRKHEPTTARNTPNPSFAAGSCDALVPRNSPAKPSSSQGFANSRWRDSHQTGGDDSRRRDRPPRLRSPPPSSCPDKTPLVAGGSDHPHIDKRGIQCA